VEEAKAKILEVQQENTKAMLEQVTNEAGGCASTSCIPFPRSLKCGAVRLVQLVSATRSHRSSLPLTLADWTEETPRHPPGFINP
jgi:hypothetical protein